MLVGGRVCLYCVGGWASVIVLCWWVGECDCFVLVGGRVCATKISAKYNKYIPVST